MNENLKVVIEQYLKIDSNYAVIISGKYGIGKTHFFKEQLAPMISNLESLSDASKKLIPVHISLFGIKNIEDIQTELFLALHPLLKNGAIKLAAGVGKSVIRGLAQLNSLGDIDKYLADVNITKSDWINYDQLVLCFDDLDRKSDTLNIKEVFGFINTLVENQGAKIILIANENKLLEDKDYQSELREKVIGVSVEFNPNTSSSFNEIISQRYKSSFKIYFEFLAENKDRIIDIIQRNEGNLRTLIFFLEHFKIVFYGIMNLFDTKKDFEIDKEEKLKAVLDFSLAVSFEYKHARLNSNNFVDIKEHKGGLSGLDFDKLLVSTANAEEGDQKKSYSQIFKETYFEGKKYYYLHSILTYITGQTPFLEDNLKTELEQHFIVEDGAIPDYQRVYNKLGYFDCLDLADAEYREQTNLMIKYAEEGKYPLKDFATVFHFATRFDNVLNFNIAGLKKRLKKGILKGKSHFKYDSHLSFHLSISDDTEFKEDVRDIMKYCLDVNNQISESQTEDKTQDLFNFMETDFDKFIELSRSRENSFRFEPFWTNLSIKKVYSRILKLSKKEIIELGFLFQDRYRRNIFESLFPEKEFLIQLKTKIEDRKSLKTKNLRNASFKFLLKHINESIENFPAPK